MSYQLLKIGSGNDLRNHLKNYKKPLWLRKIIVHHTWSPTVAQWNGMKTLEGTKKYYTDLGWDGGPHFFAAPDGIYQMTPPDEISIHSNAANSFALAVEVVGDYDKTVWQEPVYSYACGAYAALLEWAGLKVTDLEPHRKYNPEKSCPGSAITMDWVQKNVALFMNKPAVAPAVTEKIRVWKVKRIDTYAKVRQGAGFEYPESARLYSGDIFLSKAEKKDEQGVVYDNNDMWEHVSIGFSNMQNDVSNTGFVHRSLVDELM